MQDLGQWKSQQLLAEETWIQIWAALVYALVTKALPTSGRTLLGALLREDCLYNKSYMRVSEFGSFSKASAH